MDSNEEIKSLEETNNNTSENEVKKKKKKSEKLLFMVGLTGVIFMVATYAWFIGTSVVDVSPFKIKISSADGLTISLDAITFSSNIDVSEDIVTGDSLKATYADNTNHWVDTTEDNNSTDGLIPLSSIGEMDTTYSVLKLFSKSSITSVSGGYRLVSDRIENYKDQDDEHLPDEKNGYAVFDVFIKNSSGSEYVETYDSTEDEAVYLTKGSYVKLKKYDDLVSSSETSGGAGLENSARVAFMQVGRTNMANSTSANNAQRLTCTSADGDDTDGDLGLCGVTDSGMGDRASDGRGYTWNIWEPNDSKHTTDSKTHFSRLCQKRTGTNTYTDTCDAITSDTDIGYDADDDYTYTYAVKQNVASADNINIYDGLNGYTLADNDAYKIQKMNYFTDTLKNKIYANTDSDHQREPIFYLAPNSITKVRVYIWLEGQDVDNYDIDSKNMGLEVYFGFTKDQYESANLGTEYTLTVAKAGSGSGNVNGTSTFPFDIEDLVTGSTQVLTATADASNKFIGWSDGNVDNPRTVSIYDDVTYTAIFIPSTSYYVTALSNNTDWGTVSGAGEYTDTALTLTATASSGCEFVKWSDGTTTTTYSYTPTADTVITAIFKANDLTVTAQVKTGQDSYGSVKVNDVTIPSPYNAITVNYNSTAVVEAIPASGYRFLKWQDNVTTNPRVFVGIKENKSAIAEFIKVWDVELEFATGSAGNGTFSVSANTTPAQNWSDVTSDMTLHIDDGVEITITATANTGYTFSHWNDDTSDTTATKTVTVSEAATYTAHFEASGS